MLLKQDQLICHSTEGENGDCFRAALATLMNIDIQEVPHFYSKATQPDALELFRKWLGQFNLTYIDLQWVEGLERLLPDTYHLMQGESPRFPEFDHVVVAYEGKPVFDPHPDKTFITDDKSRWTITLILPKNWQELMPGLKLLP